MGKRQYDQYCGVAVALDLLGDRWTLLIVRDLLYGPKRFSDLLASLSGIGTTLLSQRLKDLDAVGIIRRATLPPPAASAVYELADDGAALRGVLLELARWGDARLPAVLEDKPLQPELVMLGMEARFDPEQAAGLTGVYELWIEDQSFRLEFTPGCLNVRAGEAERGAVRIYARQAALVELGSGALALSDALAVGDVRFDGDPGQALQFAAVFGISSSTPKKGL